MVPNKGTRPGSRKQYIKYTVIKQYIINIQKINRSETVTTVFTVDLLYVLSFTLLEYFIIIGKKWHYKCPITYIAIVMINIYRCKISTMKIHQVQAELENCSNEVKYRVLSFFCNSSSLRGFWYYFDTRKHLLIKPHLKKPFRLISSYDSEGCQPLVLKKNGKPNENWFFYCHSEILNKKYLIPLAISQKSLQLYLVDIGDSDSNGSEIFKISRVVNKTTMLDTKTPLINIEAPVTILSSVRVNYSLAIWGKLFVQGDKMYFHTI